jgi:glyoxylase-like metal-dependent hydrolase (beta-lactamase superfamily II)
MPSKHFQLEPLTDGVYAAIAKEGGSAGSNAGIVDLGDRVLVFDTFMSPQASRDLMSAAQQQTGRPVTLAVNSHWHQDHVLGNQALPDSAMLISTRRTRELIAEHIPGFIEQQRENLPRALHELEAQFQAEQDPGKRDEIGKSIDLYRMGLEVLPTLKTRLPDQTFESRLVFHGTARTAELITFGGGHTESDALLYLPGDQMAFVADLLFNGYHPWMGHGDPDEWLRIYDRIEALDPTVEVVVPGHGPVATPGAFAALRRYIPTLRRLVDEVIKAGGTERDAENKAVPAAFSDWLMPDTFRGNMRFLYDRVGVATQDAG